MNRGRGKLHYNKSWSDKPKRYTKAEDGNVDSEVIRQFRSYALELEDKQDRNERIVKVSRDLTIESKRLIFFLHTFKKGKENAATILLEAETRLIEIVKSRFLPIINELKDLDVYQYHRAYTFGVQEFMEAFSFFHYLKYEKLLTFNDVQNFLQNHTFSFPEEEVEKDVEESDKNTTGDQNIYENEDVAAKKVKLTGAYDGIKTADQFHFVSIMDYILGLSDLTGELMRYCINQVGSSEINAAFDACAFLTNLYTAMLSIGCSFREYNKKMYTTFDNVRKVEMACYTVKVRGSEMPQHMIMDVLDKDQMGAEEAQF